MSTPWTFTPIGLVRSPFQERAEVPRQPRAARGIPGRLELEPGRGFEDALQDLAGWEHLWIVFAFHLASGWRPKVQPPRSHVRRGVFATRSPYRPNPIGLSVVRLVRVEGLTVHIEDVDMVDGTPLLDIKPYVAWSDAIPGSRAGWLEDEAQAAHEERSQGERPDDPGPRWEVQFAHAAEAELEFLRGHGVALRELIVERLELGPHPHAYRRIRREGDRGVLALKSWRVSFTVEGTRIAVGAVRSGYKTRSLERGDAVDLDVHRLFVARFGRP